VNASVADRPPTSATVSRTAAVPGPVGVPVTVPVEESTSPAGSVLPGSVQVNGAPVPPVAARVSAPIAVPTTLVWLARVWAATGGTTVQVKPPVAVRRKASVTVTWTGAAGPGVVGRPVTRPVVLMASPAGRPVACQVAGSTPAPAGIASWRLTVSPTTVVWSSGSVTDGAGGGGWFLAKTGSAAVLTRVAVVYVQVPAGQRPPGQVTATTARSVPVSPAPDTGFVHSLPVPPLASAQKPR